MTAAHVVIMLIFAAAMIYYTRKWQRRKVDSPPMSKEANDEEGEREKILCEAQEVHTETEAALVSELPWGSKPPLVSESARALGPTSASLPIDEAILGHYISLMRAQPEEVVSDDVPVAVFPPTATRGWWTYATCGLGRTGGSELVMYSLKYEATIISHLQRIAQEVGHQFVQHGQTIQPGASYRLGEGIVEGSALSYLYVSGPLFESEGFDLYTDGERVTRIYMLHGITANEHEYLVKNGSDALEAQFANHACNSIDLYRHSTC